MTTDWHVSKSSRVCAVTERPIEDGEVYYSALVEDGETFVRKDFSADAWSGVDPEGLFSFWKTRAQPEEERRKRLVIDVEAFYTFFTALAGQEEPQRRLFRYLLALILTRKRVLRLDEIEKTEDAETLLLFDHRTKEDLRVTAPQATPEQLAEAQEQLNQIFETQMEF